MLEHRIEKRYFSDKSYEQVISILKKDFIYQKVSDKPYNQTIYFNTPNFDLPFELSLRARKYVKSKTGFILNKNSIWSIESKQGICSILGHHCKKKKEYAKFKVFKKIFKNYNVASNIISNLNPIFGTKYLREHFVHKKYPHLRLSLDSSITYYFFNKSKAIKLSDDLFVRLELKYPKTEKIPKSIFTSFGKQLNLNTPISKKDACHNLYNKYLFNKYNNIVPKHDLEIEAKLNISKTDQNIFIDFHRLISQNKLPNFKVYKNYPFVYETGKVQKFCISKNKYIRYTISKGNAGVTIKNNSQVVKDKYGYNCILIRQELPGNKKDIKNTKRFKELYRKKKYFLIENINNKNTYSFCIDRCSYKNHVLYQIEIEALAESSNKFSISSKVQDILTMLTHLFKNNTQIRSTTLTKQEWLMKFK